MRIGPFLEIRLIRITMKFRKADRPPDLAKVIKQKGRVRNVSGRTRVPASSRRNGKENTGKGEAPISSKRSLFQNYGILRSFVGAPITKSIEAGLAGPCKRDAKIEDERGDVNKRDSRKKGMAIPCVRSHDPDKRENELNKPTLQSSNETNGR